MTPSAQRLRRRVLAVMAGWAGASTIAVADIGDGDPALRPLIRAERAAEPWRGPPDPQVWERQLRAPDRLGPPAMRAIDLALLDDLGAGRWSEAMQRVKSGAAVNARDARGRSPVTLAAASGQDELLRELLRRGAELDRVGDDGFTALGAAAWRGHRSTVRLLVRAGANTAAWGFNGQPPLHLASLAGHTVLVQDLLALGVPLEQLNRARESALDVAAAAGQDAVMDLLIRGGADMTKAGRR